MKGRGVPLGYVEGLNDARTLLADFFSILLTQRRMNPVAHEVRDRDHADANDQMLRNDFPGRDLLGPRQEIT